MPQNTETETKVYNAQTVAEHVATMAFDFGEAVKRLKAGKLVQRLGWNGKNMWLLFVPAEEWSTSVGPSNVPNAHRLPWIGMKTVNGGFVPWLASQTDVLAEDWLEVR